MERCQCFASLLISTVTQLTSPGTRGHPEDEAVGSHSPPPTTSMTSSNMLESFRVTNFKNIADSTEDGAPLQFGPLTLLIGPNGVGKSSLLQAIDFLKAFFTTSLEEYIADHHWIYGDLPNLRQSQKKISWSCVFQIPPDSEGNYGGQYDLYITAMKRRYLNVGQETLRYHPSKGQPGYLIRRVGRDTRLTSPATGKTEDVLFYQLPTAIERCDLPRTFSP
jgi:hypothetical protein